MTGAGPDSPTGAGTGTGIVRRGGGWSFSALRWRRRSRRGAVTAAGLLLCVLAGTGLSFAASGDEPPVPRWQPGCGTACPAPTTAQGTPAGPPTRVRIPRIGIDSSLVRLGLAADGRLAAPTDYDRAGWFGAGTSPGDTGPAVIAGHIDSRSGPAVFYRLDELRPRDRIEVLRGGRWVPFRVVTTARHAKDRFPTTAVYGPTPGPELRLITCDGEFDQASGHYPDNLVVFPISDVPVPAFPDPTPERR